MELHSDLRTVTSLRRGFAISVVAAFIAMSAQRASAATLIQLTGGDTTDGVDISSLSVVAGGIFAGPNQTGPLTWQGQSFSQDVGTTLVNNITFTSSPTMQFLGASSADTFANAGFIGSATSEDNNLLTLANAGLAFKGGDNTFIATASGLTAGNTYRVDLISSALGYDANARDTQVSLNGDTATNTMNNVGGSGHWIWEWNDTAVANGSGQIIMTFTRGPIVASGPLVNAILVSAVPEPSTYAMLLGGLGILIVLRRFRSSKV
ncbi:MAG: PEP-CTERM sorting domain-containing protein [Methylacidiphilales bacterium]|nr:PEP-CTERM sorting domain-containing protein [Candidatus Methylacidiphilales bacterium]